MSLFVTSTIWVSLLFCVMRDAATGMTVNSCPSWLWIPELPSPLLSNPHFWTLTNLFVVFLFFKTSSIHFSKKMEIYCDFYLDFKIVCFSGNKTHNFLPHVCRTCGCVVNLPDNLTCGTTSLKYTVIRQFYTVFSFLKKNEILVSDSKNRKTRKVTIHSVPKLLNTS